MVGEIQKTKMGWIILYTPNKNKDTSNFDTTLMRVSNQDEMSENLNGKIVKFKIDNIDLDKTTITEVKVLLN
jgi:hypothetical protein